MVIEEAAFALPLDPTGVLDPRTVNPVLAEVVFWESYTTAVYVPPNIL
jgi:hypothetical protein